MYADLMGNHWNIRKLANLMGNHWNYDLWMGMIWNISNRQSNMATEDPQTKKSFLSVKNHRTKWYVFQQATLDYPRLDGGWWLMMIDAGWWWLDHSCMLARGCTVVYIWGFPIHGGTHSSHPFIHGSSLINHPFEGTPILGNLHIHYYKWWDRDWTFWSPIQPAIGVARLVLSHWARSCWVGGGLVISSWMCVPQIVIGLLLNITQQN